MNVEKLIFQEIKKPEQKAQTIRDNCDEVLSNYSYMRKFSQEELEDFKQELSENSIEIDILETELSEVKKEFKDKLKPKKQEVKIILKALREKVKEVKDEVFVLKDNDFYCIYNSEGELIESRPLRPAEKQTTIFQTLRTGTNDKK
jgi:hypothetical protein